MALLLLDMEADCWFIYRSSGLCCSVGYWSWFPSFWNWMFIFFSCPGNVLPKSAEEGNCYQPRPRGKSFIGAVRSKYDVVSNESWNFKKNLAAAIFLRKALLPAVRKEMWSNSAYVAGIQPTMFDQVYFNTGTVCLLTVPLAAWFIRRISFITVTNKLTNNPYLPTCLCCEIEAVKWMRAKSFAKGYEETTEMKRLNSEVQLGKIMKLQFEYSAFLRKMIPNSSSQI